MKPGMPVVLKWGLVSVYCPLSGGTSDTPLYNCSFPTLLEGYAQSRSSSNHTYFQQVMSPETFPSRSDLYTTSQYTFRTSVLQIFRTSVLQIFWTYALQILRDMRTPDTLDIRTLNTSDMRTLHTSDIRTLDTSDMRTPHTLDIRTPHTLDIRTPHTLDIRTLHFQTYVLQTLLIQAKEHCFSPSLLKHLLLSYKLLWRINTLSPISISLIFRYLKALQTTRNGRKAPDSG